jgi:prepilin-type N-terminal cleavage/methylation domain-containing protein
MKKTGFTLVELLVVIAIISIITVITVSQFQTARKRANDVSVKSDLNSLNKALQMYYADYNYFPDADPGGYISGIPWGSEFKDASGYSYMKVTPKEKYLAAYPFCYVVSADKKKFALYGQLENIEDSDCKGHTYSACGRTYCFAITSPNTSLDINGNLQ